MRELELYLHIPFCVRKCAYCDFLSAPAGEAEREAYVRALLREIASFPYKEEYCVSTVFLGGGTPSLLTAAQTEEILDVLYRSFHFAPEPEITIECNPGTADEEKLQAYRLLGINRISFGLQSANDRELALLGRIHTWEEFLKTYDAARKAGLGNINVDLMSALPGQTVSSWEQTLDRVLALAPEHISAYSLIIEEGTPFFDRYGEDDARRARGEQPEFLPSEEEERLMYAYTERRLAETGMRRYEISNYARRGYECRHNTGYWRGTEYAGFGLGASSLLFCGGTEAAPQKNDGSPGCGRPPSEDKEGRLHIRYRNPSDMEAYLNGDFSGREKEALTLEDRMEEFMFLGLRMMDGVSEQEFHARFGKKLAGVYGGTVDRLIRQELLCRSGERIALTPRGVDLSNMVMAEFLLG